MNQSQVYMCLPHPEHLPNSLPTKFYPKFKAEKNRDVFIAYTNSMSMIKRICLIL